MKVFTLPAAAPPKSTTGSTDLRTLVRVVEGKATPMVLPLVKLVRVGTGADCDIVLADRTVSRVHVQLEAVPEGILVRDLESRNGTFYLDQRVKEIVLSPGSRIRLGKTVIGFDLDTAAMTANLAYTGGDVCGSMLATSRAMHTVFALLQRLQKTTLPVLLLGESGDGKEEVARTLHAQSPVASGPLVTLNCGAFPRELVASELFGHRRGAFTGATEARKGAFETADGGTLFLDEIGELPLDIQPLLLRVLETGEVRRVGEDSAHKVRVRVVAATHRDLEAEVAANTFREDLWFRLAVIKLAIPPLRERLDDIAPLAAKFAIDAGLGDPLPGEIVEQLKARTWPGNVRELKNVVMSYAALGFLPEKGRARSRAGAGETLEAQLRSAVDLDVPYAEQKAALVDRFTALYLEALLAETGGNRTAAAKRAGL
ncbi:MAG: sigma 54-interacting transcriptional regulator, partial [Proteobacteria bacterium]|nr:sigma 54-interacting transcriptional regulator [Pseudomonadota bacterium]